MVTIEPYSSNKNLIDAIDAQLESIRKLLSILRDNMKEPTLADLSITPYLTPEDLKNTQITCNAEPK